MTYYTEHRVKEMEVYEIELISRIIYRKRQTRGKYNKRINY